MPFITYKTSSISPLVRREVDSVATTEAEFDSNETRGEYFCDCFSSMGDMNLFETSFTLFPVHDDVFDISSISYPENTVHCDHYTSYDVVPSSSQCSSPSPQGLIGASMGSVDLVYRCNTSSFPVVFDTEASLTISMDNQTCGSYLYSDKS